MSDCKDKWLPWLHKECVCLFGTFSALVPIKDTKSCSRLSREMLMHVIIFSAPFLLVSLISLAVWSLWRLVRVCNGGLVHSVQFVLHVLAFLTACLRIILLCLEMHMLLDVKMDAHSLESTKWYADCIGSAYYPAATGCLLCLCHHWKRNMLVLTYAVQIPRRSYPRIVALSLFVINIFFSLIFLVIPSQATHVICAVFFNCANLASSIACMTSARQLFEALHDFTPFADVRGFKVKLMIMPRVVLVTSLILLGLMIVDLQYGNFAWPAIISWLAEIEVGVLQISVVLFTIGYQRQHGVVDEDSSFSESMGGELRTLEFSN